MTDATGITATETALRRRLGDLGDTATVDDEAWEKIQSRIASTRSGHRRPTPKQLIAVAAAIALVCAIVLAQRSGDQNVEMVDESTTTTTEDEEDTTTSTTVAGDDPPQSATTPGGQPGGGPGSPEGTGPGGDAGGQPATGPDSPGAGPATGSLPVTPAPPPSGLMPDGRAPSVTFAASGYTVQATFWRGGGLHMSLWRPDQGYLTNWSRSSSPGQECLAGESEYAFDFPEPGSHTYSWGMVRADAAEVRIVSTTGDSTTAVIGSEAVPGLRPWIGRSPSGQVDHYEARDAAGNVLHLAPWTTNGNPSISGFDAFPDTC